MFTELPFGLTLAVTVVKLADVVIAPRSRPLRETRYCMRHIYVYMASVKDTFYADVF